MNLTMPQDEEILSSLYTSIIEGDADFPAIKTAGDQYKQQVRLQLSVYQFNQRELDEREYQLAQAIFREEIAVRKLVNHTGDWQNYTVDVLYLSAFVLSGFREIANLSLFLRAKHLDFDTLIGFDETYLLCFDKTDVLAYTDEQLPASLQQQVQRLQERYRADTTGEIAREVADWQRAKIQYFQAFRFPIRSAYARAQLGLE